MKKPKSNTYIIMGNSPSRKVFVVINYIICTLLTITSMFPVIHILAMALSSSKAVEAGMVRVWPVEFTLYNFNYILENSKFYTSFMVSVLRVVIAVPISLLCSVLVAFPLSKEVSAFKYRNIYAWFFIITMVFNAGMIPTYMIVRNTGIYNTIWALILPGAVSIFNTLILMNFFRGLPKELEESAYIDGAGSLTILFKIYMPLSKAALATITLFIFVNNWNSWFDGLIYISKAKLYPLQTYLQTILTIPELNKMTMEEIMRMGMISRRAINAAQIVVATIPILIVYPFLQKYYAKGLVIGSVKG